MAKVEHTSDARVLVGIDISKNRHEVLIAAPGKARRRRMTVQNKSEDFQRLIDVLREFGLPVTIGFEATGNYHRALMFALGSAGFDLKLVSSIALARTREALHNSWDKNDPKDAQVILRMLEISASQGAADPFRLHKRRGEQSVLSVPSQGWNARSPRQPRLLAHRKPCVPLIAPDSRSVRLGNPAPGQRPRRRRWPAPHFRRHSQASLLEAAGSRRRRKTNRACP
jgi:hypothetical protein